MQALESRARIAEFVFMLLFGLDAPVAGFAMIAATFAAFAGIELAVPFRALTQSRPRRWITNLALFAIDTLAVRLLIPVVLVGMAAMAQSRGWGLLNVLELPHWLAFVIALIALDLALYAQHWATHRLPILWRMHRVHHSDRDFDITTAARFHPFEIVLSMLYKLAVVAALGAPVWAVFAFETAFTMLTIFNHSNTRLPTRIEPWVRAVIVTQHMHRVHHSAVERETNSNYGTVLSLWDRVFRTYCARPAAGQQGAEIGLENYRSDETTRLGWSLLLPLRR